MKLLLSVLLSAAMVSASASCWCALPAETHPADQTHAMHMSQQDQSCLHKGDCVGDCAQLMQTAADESAFLLQGPVQIEDEVAPFPDSPGLKVRLNESTGPPVARTTGLSADTPISRFDVLIE